MITALTTMAAIGLTILGRKMTEIQLARQQQRISIQQQKAELLKQKAIAMSVKLKANEVVAEKKLLIEKQKTAIAAAKTRGASKEEIALEEQNASFPPRKTQTLPLANANAAASAVTLGRLS